MGHSRPWNSKSLTAGIIVAFFIFLYGFQQRSGIQLGRGTTLGVASNGKSVSSDLQVQGSFATTPAKRKAIITSVQRDDETTADWLVETLPEWDAKVYVTDRRSDEEATSSSSLIKPHSLPVNRGREASVYLTYIIHHYYDLPEYMVFIHGKRYQIHNDDPMLDTFPAIDRLNLDYVSEQGYTALRCNWMQCPKSQVEPELGFEDGFWDINGLYAAAWELFFPNETIPSAVSGPCCAQFAVTKEVVQRWPIDKYEQIRQWMWNQDGHEASMKSGLVLEYMWHILFGKPAYFCPDAKECYCKKWGLCDLDCDREGWCNGRIWQNPQKNAPIGLPPPLPSGWPASGQGEKGLGGNFPYDRWWEDPEEVSNH
ncbi:hypothetical protein LTR15_005240 [Elasticomyces elasticus]|nr:hypothetical protein LTR15_005240 [Elasticomyces elasticus]